MTTREHLIKLLGSTSGARELLRLAKADDAVADALDRLEDLPPEEALTLLGATDEPSDEPELDEREAANVRRDVQMLLESAPARERELLSHIDALMIDGAVEALSNLFRRSIHNDGGVWWTSNENIQSSDKTLASSQDLAFQVARYLQLWTDEESAKPTPDVPRLVTWAHRAVARAPELFRHVRADTITDNGIALRLQPREMWTKARDLRWSIRRTVPPRELHRIAFG